MLKSFNQVKIIAIVIWDVVACIEKKNTVFQAVPWILTKYFVLLLAFEKYS